MSEQDKPFTCNQRGCGQKFSNEDHLSVHQQKHEMSLNLSADSAKNNTFTDQTPTPTKFLRQIDEMFSNNNPFEAAFKKATDSQSSDLTEASSLDNGELNTPLPPIMLTQSVHEPEYIPLPTPSSVDNLSLNTPTINIIDAKDEVHMAFAPVQRSPLKLNRKRLEPSPLSRPVKKRPFEIVTDSDDNTLSGYNKRTAKDDKLISGDSTTSTNKTVSKIDNEIAPHSVSSNGSHGDHLHDIDESSLKCLSELPLPQPSSDSFTTASSSPNSLVSPANSLPYDSNLGQVQEISLNSLSNHENQRNSSTASFSINQPVQQLVFNDAQPCTLENNTLGQSICSSSNVCFNSQIQSVSLQNNLDNSVKPSVINSNSVSLTTRNALFKKEFMVIPPVPELPTISASDVAQLTLQLPNGSSVPVEIPSSAMPNLILYSQTKSSNSQPIIPSTNLQTSKYNEYPVISSTTLSAKEKLKAVITQNRLISNSQTSSLKKIVTSSSRSLSVIRGPSSSTSSTSLFIATTSTNSDVKNTTEVLTSPADTSTPFRGRNLSEDENSDGKRQKFLERNRAAAARCRQKRKSWIIDLERKAEYMQDLNMKLRSQLVLLVLKTWINDVSRLKTEVAQLKSMLLEHQDCPITIQQKASGRFNAINSLTDVSSISDVVPGDALTDFDDSVSLEMEVIEGPEDSLSITSTSSVSLSNNQQTNSVKQSSTIYSSSQQS